MVVFRTVKVQTTKNVVSSRNEQNSENNEDQKELNYSENRRRFMLCIISLRCSFFRQSRLFQRKETAIFIITVHRRCPLLLETAESKNYRKRLAQAGNYYCVA
jgi:hypothetical protein